LRLATVDIVVRLSKLMSHAGKLLCHLFCKTAVRLILRKDHVYDKTEPILTFLCSIIRIGNITVLIDCDGIQRPIKVVCDNDSRAMRELFPKYQPNTRDAVIAFTWEREGLASLVARW
jgi:hypothetical protein